MKEIFPGIWQKEKKLFTQNLVPGYRSHKEHLIKIKNIEFRGWDPYHSKPAAAIIKGLKVFPIKEKDKILYLGISSGATASFFSDIIGPDGIIYGVEVSERSIRDLNPVAEKRKNIVPILADARKPQDYNWIEPVDIVYQDVASRDQSDIIVRNARQFLKKSGFAVLVIKSRSINVVKLPKEVYKEELKKLGEHFEIIEKIELDPYEKDHLFLVMKMK